MELKHIVISGLGGVGGYYGAMLNEYVQKEGKGREVHFIARGESLKLIRERGLHLTTPTRELYTHPTSVVEKPNELEHADIIIIATKSYDLEENINQLKPIIKEGTILLPLLNGANISKQISAIIPEATVWEGCTYISARKPRAGEVLLENDRESLFFGSLDKERSNTEREFLNLCIEAGINAYNPDNIAEVIRKKFIMISATATGTSYFDTCVGEALSKHPEEMRALIEEVCHLSIAEGFDLGEDIVESSIKRQHIMPAESTSSMHVDFMNGARTELENLTGYVVRRCKELSIPCPTYQKMYEVLLKK